MATHQKIRAILTKHHFEVARQSSILWLGVGVRKYLDDTVLVEADNSRSGKTRRLARIMKILKSYGYTVKKQTHFNYSGNRVWDGLYVSGKGVD